jgi:hypothetical protein
LSLAPSVGYHKKKAASDNLPLCCFFLKRLLCYLEKTINHIKEIGVKVAFWVFYVHDAT